MYKTYTTTEDKKEYISKEITRVVNKEVVKEIQDAYTDAIVQLNDAIQNSDNKDIINEVYNTIVSMDFKESIDLATECWEHLPTLLNAKYI